MPGILKILHPTDFSESAGYAFQSACALAKGNDATLIVLHVMMPSSSPVLMRELIILTLILLGGALTIPLNRLAQLYEARGRRGDAIFFIGASIALMVWCGWCAYWVWRHS